MANAPSKRPTLGSLIPVVTGLVALIGAVAYAIMRYSYQQFYDLLGLTTDDVGPSSAAALTQSGVRVATFVALFALLPVALALLVSQGLAEFLKADFARRMRMGLRQARFGNRLLAAADLLVPIVAALAVYRGFTVATQGSRELNEQIIVAVAVLLVTSRRYAESLGSGAESDTRAARFVRAAHRLPSTGWIVGATLGVCGALVLSSSLPRDAKKTARRCLIFHNQPVRWIHTHRTFFGIGNLSHMAVLQVRADPTQLLSPSKLSPMHLPEGSESPRRFVYLGEAGGRDFVFDRDQRRTLQISDSSVVIQTRHARHCHWWTFPEHK